MKNKKSTVLMYGFVSLTAIAGIATCFFINVFAGIATLITILIIVSLFSFYIKQRYKDIKDISEYLTSLVNGVSDIKINSNSEGELSILTNNIYKTARKLQNQTELLTKDKMWLSNSLADISHQLKTPITSMTVMTELLRDDDLPEEKKRLFLDNISKELDKMQWMIVTLLKISKFDAGTIELKQEEVALDELLNDALMPFMIQAELRNITINRDIEKCHFTGDRQWTVEGVQNIIKNCIEHLSDGGHLDIKCRQNSIFTSLTISDNGCGIDPEDLPHIFERFYKGKNSSPGSVGIGLALSKSVFNREKAVIDVESTLNKGTTFTVKFYAMQV